MISGSVEPYDRHARWKTATPAWPGWPLGPTNSAAPARAVDLAGLPPTYVEVGELDIFRDVVRRARADRLRALNSY
jgi:acetyl esterase/lipase